MHRIIHSLRTRSREERGMTVIELTIAAALMGVVMSIFLGVMASVQSRVSLESTKSITNDQARLAIEAIDREVRSGSKMYDPALAKDAAGTLIPGYGLIVYTQANGSTRTPSAQCVQWRIENQQLKRRSYQVVSGVASVISNWRIVATGIVNRDVASPVAAFTVDSASSPRVLTVKLLSNAKLSNTKSKTVFVQTVAAIRNSTTTDPCTPIPSG